MSPELALKEIRQLLAEINAAEAAGAPGLDDIYVELRFLRMDVEKLVSRTQALPAADACYKELDGRGYRYDWDEIPLLVEDVSIRVTMGQYLCRFIRTDMLQGFQSEGVDAYVATIAGAQLHFKLKKLLITDGFFADPSTSADGQLWYALVEISEQGGT